MDGNGTGLPVPTDIGLIVTYLPSKGCDLLDDPGDGDTAAEGPERGVDGPLDKISFPSSKASFSRDSSS